MKTTTISEISKELASADSQLTNKKGVANAFKVSERLVDTWVKQKKIPSILISKRCRRFHLPSCIAAIRRFEVQAIGQ